MIENQYEHHLSLTSHKLCPCIYHEETAYMNYTLNWHKNIEILYIESGNGFVKYDGTDYAIFPEDIVIVNSGAMHGIYSPVGIKYRCIIISDDFFNENGLKIQNYNFSNIIHDTEMVKTYLAASQAIKYYETDPLEINIATMRKAILELAICICMRHIAKESKQREISSKSQEYVKKILTYIADNYNRQLSLDTLAHYAGITKYHMAREFKKLTGQTPFTYINILRCKKAKMCISQGISITEAAMECGFESVSYFSRTYKKIMGETPSRNIKENSLRKK